jgi:helicase
MLPVKGRSLVGAVKGALALRAWTRLGDFEEAGVVASCQAHEVEEVKKEALRMLQAMSALVASGIDEGAASQADDVPRKPSALECKLMALRAMVSAGLDDEQATLAMVDGIGPVLARRLIAAGVNDIEDLALAEVSDLAAIQGVSSRRAEQWLTEAAGLVALGGAFRFREAHRAQSSTDGTDEQTRARRAEGLDYFRWMRAGQLRVASPRDGAWSVKGGAQEHIVSVTGGRYACDCLDAGKGRLCKHVIAVRHEQGDVEIPRFDAEFEPMEEGGGGRMNLFSIWGERS